jgi:hypothetical protein
MGGMAEDDLFRLAACMNPSGFLVGKEPRKQVLFFPRIVAIRTIIVVRKGRFHVVPVRLVAVQAFHLLLLHVKLMRERAQFPAASKGIHDQLAAHHDRQADDEQASRKPENFSNPFFQQHGKPHQNRN